MSVFVLDASVTLSWCYKNEASERSAKALEATIAGGAIAPAIWSYEVTNFLATAARTGRMSASSRAEFIEWLVVQPVAVERSTLPRLLRTTLAIADRLSISAYDAAYLELALREGLPLATLDESLRRAAPRSGVALYI